MIRGSKLGREKDLSLLQNAQTASGVHPGSYQCVPGAVRPECVTDHSPSSAEIKNKWILTSTVSFTYGLEVC
jgi:hypothetical protein